MRKEQALCILGMLLIASLYDIKLKKIPNRLLLITGAASILYRLLFLWPSFFPLFHGLILGIGFYFLARITGEAFGKGDAILMGILAINMGGYLSLAVFFIALFLAAIGSVFFSIRKGFYRKAALPFVPFLTLSYSLTLYISN